tara:strand:- start:97049 stop:97489 length:441 start_codon:yes stop_codon:yes gene_type:complete
MSSIKNKVLAYLKTDRKFNSGRQLYVSFPGHNRAYARRLGAISETDDNAKTLFYELGKLAGIDERVVNSITKGPLESGEPDKVETKNEPVDILKDQVESIAYPQLKSLVSELQLEVADQKKITLQAAYLEHLRGKSEEEEEQKKST